MPFFSRVLLPLALFIYIAIETYLKLNQSSLCEATGCKLAGELLRFNPLYLNYLGLGVTFVLLVLGYLSLKSKVLERLFFIILYSAIAFEATILGYQFIANPQPCIFCLGIFSSLIFMALLSKTRRFAAVLTVMLSIFLGLSTLAIGTNKPYVTTEGLYLIQSKSCPRCTEVKSYMKEHDIKYTDISVNEVSARSFLKFVDISTIPVLIIKERSGTTLLTGVKKIISHFEKQKPATPTEELTQRTSTIGLATDLFSATSEPGCAISVVDVAPCEDNNITQAP